MLHVAIVIMLLLGHAPQELNVMWALHEMSGEHFDKFLQVVINNL